MTPQQIRDQNLAFLNSKGFRPATWMPLPSTKGEAAESGFAGGTMRPANEIAVRFLCHGAVFAWGSAPPAFEDRIEQFVLNNDLRKHMTADEIEIITHNKVDAAESFSNTVGWRLENMWSLAWILGLAEEPSAVSGQLSEDVCGALLDYFLPDFSLDVDSLLRQGSLQPVEEVIRLEDLFYLAHNAVRSGQLGHRDALPDGFDPIGSGGAIHERRHSLTWALSPGVSWEGTDLST